MKVLQIHNFYQTRGGEDLVVLNEKELLQKNGIEVVQYHRDSREILDFKIGEKVKLLRDFSGSKRTYIETEELINKEGPDICHLHNWVPLISPSIFEVCKKNKIPLIQTLHNYRYLCPNNSFFRDGKICQMCSVKNSFLPAVKYKCFRNSYLQTYLLQNVIKNNLSSIISNINLFISPSEFCKETYKRNGFPSDKIKIKSNFLSADPGAGENFEDYFLFVGRYTEAKGSVLLIKAFNKLKQKLTVIGNDTSVNEQLQNISYKGIILSREKIYNYYKNAFAVIFPSIMYEVMPMTIIEAFACGKPVIASRLGVMEEMIEDGKTGLLFEPGNVDDLINKIKWAANNPEEIVQMGRNARQEFLDKYTADKNISILKEIYNFAINGQE